MGPSKLNANTFPKFSAYRNATLTSSASGSIIVFDTEIFDIGNNYNTSNGRFTAPATGYYEFNGLVGNTTATGIMYCQFLVNGAVVKNGEVANVSAGNNRHPITGLLYLTSGDYVELKFFGGGGSTIAVNRENCYFEGHLVP